MTEHIKTIIDKYIKKNKKKQNQYQNIQNILEAELSQKITEKIQIEFRNKKEAVIFVSSSAAAYEVKLKEGKIIKTIKQQIPKLKKIKIKVK